MQELFAWNFNSENKLKEGVSLQIEEKIEEIDKNIKLAAPSWPIEKINKVDLAILRLAIYELILETKNPPKVVIDEAVELAKQYGSESSPSFINGALGKVISQNKITTD